VDNEDIDILLASVAYNSAALRTAEIMERLRQIGK